jgi:hypothetical protein
VVAKVLVARLGVRQLGSEALWWIQSVIEVVRRSVRRRSVEEEEGRIVLYCELPGRDGLLRLGFYAATWAAHA